MTGDRLFGHGDFRIWLLKLLAEEPRHGYDLIRAIEEETVGLHTPSAGSVYPRLAALEEEGLVESEETDDRRVYRITDEGRAALAGAFERVERVGERIRSASDLASAIRDEVHSSVRELRQELRRAAFADRDVAADVGEQIREEADRMREDARRMKEDLLGARDEVRRARETARRARQDARHEAQRALHALREDLDSFTADVVASARQHRIDRDRLVALRDVLRGARDAAVEALRARPSDG